MLKYFISVGNIRLAVNPLMDEKIKRVEQTMNVRMDGLEKEMGKRLDGFETKLYELGEFVQEIIAVKHIR